MEIGLSTYLAISPVFECSSQNWKHQVLNIAAIQYYSTQGRTLLALTIELTYKLIFSPEITLFNYA